MNGSEQTSIYSLIASTSIALNRLSKEFSKKRLYTQLQALQKGSIGLTSTEEVTNLLISRMSELEN